jgi:protein-S-isoprenylcysteine O-methyltransferase Ste14
MSFSDFRQRLEQTRFYDWAMRGTLIVYSSFLLFADIVVFLNQIFARPSPLDALGLGVLTTVLARMCQWMFIALFAILPVFRLRPIAKSSGILPRLAPLVAIVLSPMFIFLERAPPNALYNSVSVALSLIAGLMAVVSLTFLGRSFSIMPEARRLVKDGPYKWVRHPIYICEMMVVFAMFLQYRSWAAAGLFILLSAIQICRAVYEEKVLATTFPDFEVYRRDTDFLIPSRPFYFLPSLIKDRATLLRLVAVAVCALAGLATSILLFKHI